MEFLQLKYFFESSKNESFAKTAEKYMVPTSSVSASVKRLEKELGCGLFDRECNRIRLNSKGKRFQQSLSIVFGELDQAVEELSSLSSDTREIRMLVRAMRDDITDYIIEFNKKYPHIAFKITLDFKETNLEKYDIIIDEKTNSYKEYESFELLSMRLRLVTSQSSPLCKKRLGLNKLSGESFISWGEESNMHRILVGACKKAGFYPNISVMSNDMKCHEKLIESGIGIGLARENLNKEAKDNIKALDITDFDEIYSVCSYYKKQAAYGNVKLFLNFLKTKAQ